MIMSKKKWFPVTVTAHHIKIDMRIAPARIQRRCVFTQIAALASAIHPKWKLGTAA
jgi:hypothetical protein